jgi:hypothetical protein
MARGQPDYGEYARTVTIAGLSDLGELAARLGSIVTLDRRGNVLWLDNFDDGIGAWGVALYGTGAAAASSTTYFRSGGNSFKLTGGSDGALCVNVWADLQYSIPSKMGMEFCISTNVDVDHVDAHLWYQSSSIGYWPTVHIDRNNDRIQIEDRDAGAVTVVTPTSFCDDLYHFHSIKLVVDVLTGKYTRLIVDGIAYDLSSYNIPTLAASAHALISPVFYVYSDTGQNGIAHLDNVIITQNEP